MDTSQGISVGDAILTFLGDTTQLDQAFDRVATEAETKMAAAADSVSQIGDAADDAGVKLGAAGNSGTAAGEKIADGMGQSRRATYEARGEAALLGEAFGIHLPRHVRSFVAELPGIGTALSAAFAATAVLFLIEALVKGVEKIQEWADRSQKIAEAWDQYNQTIYTASTGMQKEIDSLQRKFLEMTQGPVAGLDFALKHLETTAFETFAHIEKDVAEAVKAMQEASSSLVGIQFNVFKDASKDLDKFRNELQNVMREAAQAHPENPFAAYDAAIAAVQQKERDLTALIKQRTAASGADASAAVDGLHAERQAVNDMLPLLQQGIELQKEKDRVLKQSRSDEAASQGTTNAKQALDAQLAAIETWKSAQHAAYETGKTDAAAWRVAEVQASDAAAIAHEDYLQKLIALYTRSGQAIKAQETAQQLATLQTKDAAKETETLAAAMEKHRQTTHKIVEEYGHLIDANVAKDFEATARATEKLTAAEEQLSKAESKLAEDKLFQHYKDQEAAITKLAEMQLISEKQKNDRLELLEHQQANAAIAILNDQLAKEETVVRAAAARLAQIKLSPGVSPAAVIEAEAQLKKLETAVINTQAQIVQTQEKFNKQSEQNSKSHYGRALTEARAFGQELLAEQLKENHALLLAAQQELKLTKARGEDTTAIQQKITALKQNETQLEKEARTGKIVTDQLQQNTQAALLAARSQLQLAKAHGQNTTAIEKEITDLQKLLTLMKQLPATANQDTQAMKGFSKALQENANEAKQMAQSLGNAFADAMEQVMTGQKTVGEAAKEMIANLAEQWGKFYIAKGIADMFTDPAAGAVELAEGTALLGLGVALGAGGSGGGGSNGAPTGNSQNPAGLNPTQTSSSGGGSNQTVSVPKLAAGGIVSKPTTIVAGDSKSGGEATEGILPLSDPSAMRQIAEAILPGLSAAIGLGSTRDPKQEFNFAEPGTAAAPGFRFDGSTAAGSGIPTVGEALGFTPRFTPASYDSRLPAEKPGLSRSEATPSDKQPDSFGTPSEGERPGFDFSQTPMPREMPDMQALAAQFGGLLSAPTLRAASNREAQTAASRTAPAIFDQAAMEKFAGHFIDARQGSSHGDGSGTGDTHNHFHIDVKGGMMSPDNISKVMKKMNRMVQNRTATLNATNSLRVTRRSQ